MIEIMFPRTVSNILDYDVIKATAKKYVEDAFIDIITSFGDNLVLQTMDAEHLSVVSEHVSGNPTLTLQELLDYINTDNVYKEKEFVDELSEHFGNHVEYKLLEGYTIYKHDHTPLTTGYGKAGVIILNVDDTASVINSHNGMMAIDEWIGENAASKLPINLYIEFQNNFNVNGNRPGETTPAYWRSYPYIEDEVYVTNDPYYHVEPSPEPTPPTPVSDWEDVDSTIIEAEFTVTGTIMSDPQVTSTGTLELDLTQYRINPEAFDFEGAGYSLIELAKFIANNSLFDAYMSAAQIYGTSYWSDTPGDPANFQFGFPSAFALGTSENGSWNYIDGLPLKFSADGETNWVTGFVTVSDSNYAYPSRNQKITRTDGVGVKSSMGVSSAAGCWFAVNEEGRPPALALVRTYINRQKDIFWINPITGDPIIIDFDSQTSKLKFSFGNLDQWNFLQFAKGQKCLQYKLKFSIRRSYNNVALFQRYVGSGTPTVPSIPEKTIKKGYVRSVGYQLQNKSVNSYTTNYLYGDGSSASLYGDNNKTYTLLGAYAVDGTSIPITSAHMTLVESGGQYSLRLVWQAAAQFCYCVYSEV